MTVIYKVEVTGFGTTYWYNQQGQLHREGGLPAVEYADGAKQWLVNGQFHREGGLPAIEFADGGKEWWFKGRLHREGGLPAVEFATGGKEWYVNGHQVTEEQAKAMFNKPATNLQNSGPYTYEQAKAMFNKPTCNGKVVEIDGKKFKLVSID